MTTSVKYDTSQLDRFIEDMRTDLWAASPESLDTVERRLRRIVDDIVADLNVVEHAPDYGSDN